MKLKAIDKLALQNLLSSNDLSLKLASIIRDILKEDDRSQEQAFKNLQGCKKDKYMPYVSAFCSLFGIGTKEDIEAARREMPSNPSDRFYQHLWGVICERSKDIAKSYDWHKRAATQGHSVATISLWLLYDAGHPSAIKDQGRLFLLFIGAAVKEGYVVSKIFLALAHFIEKVGTSIIRNYEVGERLLAECEFLLDQDKDLDMLITMFCLERSEVKQEGELVSLLQAIQGQRLLSKPNVNGNEEMGNRLLDLVEKQGSMLSASVAAHIFRERGEFERAFKIFREAVKQGIGLAEFGLGLMYEEGQGTEKDLVVARQWFTKAAEHGAQQGRVALGLMYLDGRGGEKNLKRALEEFEKASEQGLGVASFCLGLMHENGEEVAVDLVAARKWHQKRAFEEFRKTLGRRYERAPSISGYEKESTARKLYERGSDQGSAEAQNKLGEMCLHGRGGKQDVKRALEEFEKASNRGLGVASFTLGEMYRKGTGVAIDLVAARKWYVKGAEQEHVDAQYCLAFMCWRGEGGRINLQEAHTLFQKAARKNHSGALNNLGVLHGQGEGVEQDLKVAADYFRSASEMGNIFGHINNGLVQFEFGNREEAQACYEKAVAAQSLLDVNADNKSRTLLVFSDELSRRSVNQGEVTLQQDNPSDHKLAEMRVEPNKRLITF